MKEENKGASKNKWSRIFRKKWFFPAVYLTIAAVLLSVVVWYQNMDNQVPDAQEENGEYIPSHDQEAEPVLDQQEVIQMPVTNQEEAEIVTKFYDPDAEQEELEKALILYNNKYYQSDGVDIASANGETFDVVAALSGTIQEVKKDPLLGNVVILSHENEVMTYYASLEEVSVKKGAEVKQGDKLGTAGKNVFGKDSGTHVYFELRKDGNKVNPEAFFNQPVSALHSITEEASEEAESTEDAENSADEEGKQEENEQVDDTSEEQPKEDENNEEDSGSDVNDEQKQNEQDSDATSDASESA
ncbi:MAG: peptidoglycan DD-metalloendopeptidase family protein [Bacillota bacterium]|uniref:Peptidoglycan DD-metalloendopeptidase family protein n=1 Tax=Virgibacillus salarius TaxID=447199 RepID=A0A941IAS3_9BACI|nr:MULTISPECIES: M23 family metallopeptidase [Virgibacillus]MBR7795662.1 peptidoglycan DD-metalloendopeptidase family protein [Virgibacillus salarius]NAZ08375.1 peptidoglycan DD-metalloendopeptidase family protein [Agaribacter marinus]WBX81895.1 M23 family metallopeptidase [Virgibacillus salarius]